VLPWSRTRLPRLERAERNWLRSVGDPEYKFTYLVMHATQPHGRTHEHTLRTQLDSRWRPRQWEKSMIGLKRRESALVPRRAMSVAC
jgi:hypothetical protein